MRRNNAAGRLRKPIPLYAFAGIVSIATLVLYNLPFFAYVAANNNLSRVGGLLLMASLGVVMLTLNFLMAYLVMFMLRRVGRVLLAILAVVNATAVYFIHTYSVIIDSTTIENVFNTRWSEASGFFSWGLWLTLIGLGVLPAMFCLVQPVAYGKARRLAAWCGGALALMLAVALANIGQTLWIGQHDTELGGLLQPWSYLVNMCRVVSSHRDKQAEEIKLPDGSITDDEKAVVVLVIGESARKANFQLYGYGRDTNPRLARQQGLRVYEATSCATYTTAGTKAILEPQDSGDLYEVLPNYAFRTGADVSWRTSNWGEPPIHIDEYLTDKELVAMYPDADGRYDGILFRGLRERIETSPANKVLIVLHTSASHGPNYADKYPKEMEFYKPVANNPEEGEKNIPLLVNAYDNTIRYTDSLLSALIDTLRTMDEWKSAMLFVSDHGESLGENMMFMHGLPLRLAPREQYEIPFLVWTSEGFRTYKPVATSGEPAEGELPAVIDQHYVFHSVLNLLSIQSPAYNGAYDIFEAAK
ncbi:MAG: sulfatase-like hydrolase/transferase [Bacteroidaceae bacterium]|nr:sulfatase-like hydrolase/transferase [Bacteroidaceae bacterium]